MRGEQPHTAHTCHSEASTEIGQEALANQASDPERGWQLPCLLSSLMDRSLHDLPTTTLDPTVLETIRSWYSPDDPDPVPELTEAFVEDATARLAALREAVSRGDVALTSQAAHSLKGMCGAIGAMRMNALSLQVEQGGLDEADDALTIVDTLEREFARVRQALRMFVKAC